MLRCPLPIDGDQDQAQTYVERIRQVLENDDLSHVERRRLYKHKTKWQRRADGKDERWNQFGVRPGRMRVAPIGGVDPSEGAAVDTAPVGIPKDDDDEEVDWLTASILKKFGGL